MPKHGQKAKSPDLADQAAAVGLSWLARLVERIEAGEPTAADVPHLLKAAEFVRQRRAELDGPPTADAKTLATWLGVSPQTISSWSRDVEFPRPTAGRHDVAKVLKWFRERFGELQALRSRFDRLSSTLDGHKKTKAEQAALDLARAKGQLVNRQSVIAQGVRKVHRLRTELERVPAIVARKAGLDAAAEQLIRDELKRLCNQFADGG